MLRDFVLITDPYYLNSYLFQKDEPTTQHGIKTHRFKLIESKNFQQDMPFLVQHLFLLINNLMY